MSQRRTLGFAGFALAGLLVACGQPRSNNGPLDPSDDTDNDIVGCESNTDCDVGTCNTTTGECEFDGSCTNHNQCPTDQYCWFDNPPSPWVPGTEGTCTAACANDGECSFGQQCYEGQCYTLVDCNPDLNNSDCPPGEVCREQNRTCGPPGACSFQQDCPMGWQCRNDECIDPTRVDYGPCSVDDDCDSYEGCENESCECDDGACRPEGGCVTYTDCDTGNYCNQGACQPATPCGGGNDGACSALGLVCVDDYCVNPPLCGAGNTCDDGLECRTQWNPPSCVTPDTNECFRDEQCGNGQYCDLLTGTCKTGCRNDYDCEGECGASPVCTCSNSHLCRDDDSGEQGDDCTSNSDCGGGMLCAYTDPMMSSFCDAGDFGGGDFGFEVPVNCDKSCRVTCDLFTNLITNTCPEGTACGGPGSGDPLGDAIMALMNVLMSGAVPDGEEGSATASVCY